MGGLILLKQKSQTISKHQVWRAYKKVRANRGSAGIDNVSLEEFGLSLEDNLYKLWNRMASGSYFPPPVMEVEIPKKDGKIRKLGIPTVSDRIAQMVVREELQPHVDQVFNRNSYGYRPGKSAHGAIEKARSLCWKYDWVVDLDIKGFFDNLDHELLMLAVNRHTDQKWIKMYIERWLKAPVQKKNGNIEERSKGTPQGGVISPLLANIFLHYAFDKWLEREFPSLEFERYADDAIVHCKSFRQAEFVLAKIKKRLKKCKLELHPEKTKIIYCKDSNRKGNYEHTEFTFLGYSFCGRLAKSSKGRKFKGFLPGASKEAIKKMSSEIRRMKIHLRTDLNIEDVAKLINPKVRGWMNYYGKFHKRRLSSFLFKLNFRIWKWIRNKYKRFRYNIKGAKKWLSNVSRTMPGLFAHWCFGL